MGGGSYAGDVEERTRSSEEGVFDYQGHTGGAAAPRQVHPELNPQGRRLVCDRKTPIVVAMDVTRSRGDDSRIVYAKLPMFVGQIYLKGYVDEPSVSFAAIGDAACGDRAPLQVGAFAHDNTLDDILSHCWLEEGGGGTGQESYELAAYFYARHADLSGLPAGKKGFFFFIGDEGFYPEVDASQVRSLIGDQLPANLPSAQVFAELDRKFEVFLLYPQKPWKERKADIDAEIQRRVEQAGGLYKGVDVRASLLWNNRNDLDLHMITPAGEHIYYGAKQATCGGWLDVDMNVNGETTKPVENIRWRKGQACKGHYRVYVQNYRFHEADQAPTPFEVEVEVNGQVRHFKGVASPHRQTGAASDVPVFEFDYDPTARPVDEAAYAGYNDSLIKQQWAGVLRPGHLLTVADPKAIVDAMLGALALGGEGRDLAGYLDDMRGRQQTDKRLAEIEETLGDLSRLGQPAHVAGAPPDEAGPVRQSKTRRL